jgi:hypothetical protein
VGEILYFRSWVDVANFALGQLSQGSIASLNDGTQQAAVCKQHLPAAIASVVGVYNWRCLTGRLQLAQSSITPAFGYGYAYVLPGDFERHVKVFAMASPLPTFVSGGGTLDVSDESGYRSGEYPWSIEDGYLLTNAAYAYLVYVKTPPDAVGTLPKTFATAIGAELAVIMSVPFASDPELKAEVAKLSQAAMDAAIKADASLDRNQVGPAQRGWAYTDQLRR